MGTTTDTVMDDFVLRAAIAGIGVALATGPLGCFIVWRRMAYFGDTLSHAALAGVTIGILFGVDPIVGVIGTGFAVGLLLLALQGQRELPADTLLGILSHGALAAGLIVVGFMDSVRVDLLGYLFGDILAVTPDDILLIGLIAAFVLTVLAAIWRPLIALTVHEDVALAEGIRGPLLRFIFTGLIAVTVAIAMKIIGVLLVTALLIIPAAAARRYARGPESMALMAVLAGIISVLGGLGTSLAWDLPSGPAIVTTAVVLFIAAALPGGFMRRVKRP